MTPAQKPRKGDGMIRAKVTGGGPCGYAQHFNVYPDKSGEYDTYIRVGQDGGYKRTGIEPDYTYEWTPA